MKIIQLCPQLNQGGVERGTIELADYMSKKKMENYICSNGGVLLKDLNKNTKHFSLPIHKKNPVSIIINSIKLAKYVKENEIDIIHARSRAPAWVGWFASMLTGAKYIATYHGCHSHNNIFKNMYSAPLRKGVKIGVVSDFMEKHLIDVFNVPKEKIHKTYRCFDENKFSYDNISDNDMKEVKDKYNISENDMVLCMVGRFSKIKGQIELLEVLSKLKNKNWKMIFVGSDNTPEAKIENEMKEFIKDNKLEDKVILAGRQNNPELFYAISDICFAVSMVPEAFGRTAIESQAMGKITMATACGGQLETVIDGKTGFLLHPSDTSSWVKPIDHVLSEMTPEQRSEMGKTAKEWVYSKFTLEKMCESEIDMYKEVYKTK